MISVKNIIKNILQTIRRWSRIKRPSSGGGNIRECINPSIGSKTNRVDDIALTGGQIRRRTRRTRKGIGSLSIG